MNKTNTSIRQRLLTGTIFAVAVSTLAGSYFINLSQRKALTHQLDNHLRDSAELQIIEIEIKDGKPFQEWLLHISQSPVRTKRDLIQVWDLHHQKTYRSPALEDHDLPMIHAGLNEYRIENTTLANGKPARALGIKVTPSYDEIEEMREGENYDHFEHIFVIALETDELEESLADLRHTLALVVFTTLVLCILAIFFNIRRSLAPITVLEKKLQARDLHQLGKAITIPEDFPKELRGLVTEYNTLLKRIEEVRSSERDFSSHAAHELRTPLAGIQAILEQAVASPRQPKDYDQRIKKALTIAKEMKGLVGHLMQFARLQSGNHTLELERLNLHEFIEASWEGYSDQASARGIVARLNLNSKNFIREVDERLLQILLSNLIGNAVSYSKPGSQIKIETSDQGGGFRFSISNRSGTPLPKNLNNLLEPFFRADPSRDTTDGHSGIGLSLCREIVRTLEAQISLRALRADRLEIVIILN